MSELSVEEKETINELWRFDCCYNKQIKILLNLIEKQQKELNNIKEIEKSHQEENGKLRVKLTKQEKMIELMSRFIDTELSSEHLSKVLKIEVKPLETYREDIKQYFEKKAEEVE